MRPSVLWLAWTLCAGCAPFGSTLARFPDDRSGPTLRGLRGESAAAYEIDQPTARVRRVAVLDRDWSHERAPSGAIVRRQISVAVGFQSTRDLRCAVDDIMFAQDSTGPGTWGSIRVFGVGNGGGAIDCAALGGATSGRAQSPLPTTAARPRPPSGGKHDRRFDQSPADLEVLVAAKTAGYSIEGPPSEGTLEAFAPPRFALARGRCYLVVLRLGAGAAFSDQARRGVSFVFTGIPGSEESIGGPGIAGPGGVASTGCMQRDAPSVSLDLQARTGSANNPGVLHDLGRGAYTLQLYAKSIDDAQLKSLAADEARQTAALERTYQEEAAKRCGECRRARDLCVQRSGSARDCLSDFDSCLFRAGVRESCK